MMYWGYINGERLHGPCQVYTYPIETLCPTRPLSTATSFSLPLNLTPDLRSLWHAPSSPSMSPKEEAMAQLVSIKRNTSVEAKILARSLNGAIGKVFEIVQAEEGLEDFRTFTLDTLHNPNDPAKKTTYLARWS